MSTSGLNLTERLRALSGAKRALFERLLKGRSHDAPRTVEPVAVIGMGCRLPGADSPDAYWRLLMSGLSAVRDAPAERWPAADASATPPRGGFLDDVKRFDARFFGLAPAEAAQVDPQQRLLLEVAWEALEDAGRAPDRLAGRPVGVFVGLTSNDYAHLQLRQADGLPAGFGAGNAPSMAAGRLSHTFSLRGPSLTVDAACASTLVALHLACQSLREHECELALVGGVSVMLLPEITQHFARTGVLSGEGHCKSFDAGADGYVRGEGCGVVVLARLADALVAGDHVRAVVRGSAVNNDGRAGALAAPSSASQAALLRRALSQAGAAPDDVQYVEAHGTGTAAGDPIELEALAEVFQQGRAGAPLLVGSAKPNIGHTEAAAGVAGLIKTVLALRYGTVPPQANFRTLTARAGGAARELRIPTAPTPWPAAERRLAGVSAFGFNGTNAHVLLEAAAPVAGTPPCRDGELLVLSARSESALRALAESWSRRLSNLPEADWPHACHTSTAGRTHFAHRAALLAADTRTAATALAELARGERHSVRCGTRGAEAPGVAFLFTGQGCAYPGMARGLFASQSVFRATLARCDAWLRANAGLPLLDRIYGPSADAAALQATAVAQPAIFAVQVALVELWRAWGLKPQAVVGHSVGEFAAAWTAGALELEEALALVTERGRILGALPAGGAMAGVQAGPAEVADALRLAGGEVVVAAVNARDAVTLAGPVPALERALHVLRAEGVACVRLDVPCAFHSPQLDGVLEPLEAAARRFAARAPRLRWISTLTGRAFEAGETPDALYWRRQAREAVRFQRAVEALAATGCALTVDIGPTATLAGLARRAWPGDGGVFLASLQRGLDDWQALLGTVADLYARGIDFDWQQVDRGSARGVRPMPTYPFERETCWIDETRSAAAPRPSAARGAEPALPSPATSAR